MIVTRAGSSRPGAPTWAGGVGAWIGASGRQPFSIRRRIVRRLTPSARAKAVMFNAGLIGIRFVSAIEVALVGCGG